MACRIFIHFLNFKLISKSDIGWPSNYPNLYDHDKWINTTFEIAVKRLYCDLCHHNYN